MISVNALTRESERVSNYMSRAVQLAGPEEKENVVHLFGQIQDLFPQWVIGTCPMMHPDIRFITPNAEHLFGYTADDLLDNSRMERSFTFVHDKDQEALFQCFVFMQDFIERITPEEHCRYRFGLYYRYRRPDGDYIHLYDEKAVMFLGEGRNLYYSLFRDITEEKSFSGVKIDLLYKDDRLQKIQEFRPGADNTKLSKREKELISLMKKGLSTKEMAGNLKISQYTVRNIKSKLFDKYNVSNSIELLNMAG